MPTLDINGRKVQVGDEFLQLSPDEQEATINEIAGSLPKQASPMPSPSRWTMNDEIVNTMTFGGADKMRAAAFAGIDKAVDAVQGKESTWSENYDRHLAGSRKAQEQYGEEYPYRKLASQGAGVAASVATLPAVAAFKGGGMLKNMANAGMTGGLYGGAAGALEDAESLPERAGNTLFSAGAGTVLGSAIPPLTRAAGRTWKAISSYFANRGYEAKALNAVLDRMQASGMTPQDASRRLSELGPEGMLADISPGMQVSAGGTAVADNAAGNLMAGRVAARREGGRDRVGAMLDRAFGPAKDPYTHQVEARASTRATDPAYELAKEFDVDISSFADDLTKQVQAFNGKGPIGSKLLQIRDMITDSRGNLLSNGAHVHNVREQIDSMIESAFNAGDKKVGGRLLEVRRSIDAKLKAGIPGFAEADAAQTQSHRSIEAFELGREMLQGGPKTMTPARIEAEVAERAGERVDEIADMRQGLRSEIDRVLSNERMDPGLQADRILSRDRNRGKVAAVAGPNAIPDLVRGIDREATFRETANLVEPGRGSRTAVLDAAKEMWSHGARPSLAGDTTAGAAAGLSVAGLSGATAGAAAGAANNLRQRIAQAMTGKASSETIQRAGDILTATGQGQAEALRKLEETFNRLPKREMTAVTVERLLASILGTQVGRVSPDASKAIRQRAGR